MVKYIVLGTSITLAAAWIIRFGMAGYPSVLPLYTQTAAWWHIGLFVLWFTMQLWANVLFVIWIYERLLRQ